MAKAAYIGVGGIARKTKKLYIGVGGVARKVKKAYIGVGGVARLFYSGSADVANMSITYTGTMIDSGIVTMSGVQYRLLTLTSSGTLSVDEEVGAEVWMCGGGTSGIYNSYSTSQGSGGGAGAFTATGAVTLSGGMAAIVGSGGATPTSLSGSGVKYVKGGATSFNGLETSVAFSAPNEFIGGISGGTGGGGSEAEIGYGDGITKYPFGDSTYFSEKPHCAGGGGGAGARMYEDYDKYVGGAGGSNGGNGKSGSWSTTTANGAGGLFGGGNGASSATFYGGGGGGNSNTGFTSGINAGNGYQGVIYIRIPVEQ